jgi:site-specific DNA-adenine methylase
MKNHFFFAYAGNKRQEVEHIYENINFKNIDTLVEPFCGSCALSYYIWSQNRTKNYKYILNDLDSNLIELLRIVRDDKYRELEDDVNKKREEILSYEDDMIEAKKIYVEYIKQKDLKGYLLTQKYHSMRAGMFPLNQFDKFSKVLDLSLATIYDFLKTADIEIYNEDANKIIDKYDNKKTFIFLDPPYIANCNNYYSTDTTENIQNIYEMLYHKGLKNFKCKILICHENNWLFKILFNDYLDGEKEYRKPYENTIKGKHKITTHIIVKNYKKLSYV